MPLNTAVIYGSVRTARKGIRAARYIVHQLEQRGHTATLVDPLEHRLPLLDKMYKEYAPDTAPEPLEALAELFRRADGFVVVSGEYNHSLPPPLTNLLDHFLNEFFFRPSAIVTYSAGRFGGVRAGEHLRCLVGELGMPAISSMLSIPRVQETFDEDGRLAAESSLQKATDRFLTDFEWWQEAAHEQRRSKGTPY